MKIDTSKIKTWSIASKTRPIKAKPLINLLVDRSVTSKFLVDTLEGKQLLGDGSVICVGEAGDTWQQIPKKLLQKYSVTAIDNDGWMICEPLPDNAVNVIEITRDFLQADPYQCLIHFTREDTYKAHDFCVIGQWGEITLEGINTQWGDIGDFVCQNRNDPTDIWVVKRKLFLNTYVIKS